jgi:hypothetical protein
MIRKAAGEAVCLVDAGKRTERFDILPPLVATDGTIHDLDMDHSHAPSHCEMMIFFAAGETHVASSLPLPVASPRMRAMEAAGARVRRTRKLFSIQIAEHKAQAAATFPRSTKVFGDGIQLMHLNYLLAFDGVIASRGVFPDRPYAAVINQLPARNK